MGTPWEFKWDLNPLWVGHGQAFCGALMEPPSMCGCPVCG
jgi:hypothetical protein